MIKNDREYRAFNLDTVAEDYRVKGYASTFDPYEIYEYEGIKYFERVDRDAFAGADMSDVIFLYNHKGMVYARMKNQTLICTVDDHGLYIEADLSKTTQSREIYEAIKTGLVDQMSFAFTVNADAYDRKTHTRTIQRFKKIYDVSAVSIPANPGTDISAVSARSFIDGVIEMEKAERLEEQRKLQLAKAKYDYLMKGAN